jgi:DNA-directed RNA polymerase subunit M/transcription elongation factor TFIIS
MDPYLIAFLLIVISGSVIVYTYYLKEKKGELESINRGFCPKCHHNSIELVDQRSGGCSGPKLLSYECFECGYYNSAAVENGSSGSGRCL